MAFTSSDIAIDASKLRLDRWLRFTPAVEARYEREAGAQRVAALRSASLFGLVLYNLYGVTSYMLTHDVFWWAIGRVSARKREALMFAAMSGAALVPMLLFALTQSTHGAYTFGEQTLMLVFGNMVMTLRFRDAIAFTAIGMAAAVTAVLLKSGLDPTLRVAFLAQYATACALTLDANRRVEKRRCLDYLGKLTASLRSEAAESAIDNMRDLVETDALTGLPNRRHLDRTLEAWFADARPVAVMMIDLDHFKLFNDTLGHPAGDDCLRAVAGAFVRLVEGRERLIARFGGEEFVLVARDLDPLAAARVASMLVKAVERLAISHPGRSDGVGVVTVSVGVAIRGDSGRATLAQVLKLADEALYEAKRRGRNRHVISELRGARLFASG